jgi:hypothetical protein
MNKKKFISSIFVIALVLISSVVITSLHGLGHAKAATNSTFSGILRDEYGSPIAGAAITLANGVNSQTGITDTGGAFNLTVIPGSYYVGITGDNIDGMTLYGPGTDSPTIDLNSDMVQDLQLNVAKIHVTLEDSSGLPLPGVEVRAKGEGLITYFPGYQVDAQVLTSGPMITDSNGTTDITTLVGENYLRGTNIGQNICANYQNSYICLKDDLTVTGDTQVTLLQKLSSPTNLLATSPTHVPNLSWSTMQGVSYYNVYRAVNQSSGPFLKIGSTTSTSFSDNGVGDGNYLYYVTAVNAVQESGASNAVNVIVDNTNPTITYTLSAAPNTYGWNNNNVTVTFNCADSGSGIATCSSPITLSSEGANQTVNGTATDNLGNTSTSTVTLNIDKAAPVASGLQLSVSKKTSTLTVSANASDALSGVSSAEFYIDSDPGFGNGITMSFAGGQVTAQSSTTGLSKGLHTIYVRVKDKAGNWSTVVSGTARI